MLQVDSHFAAGRNTQAWAASNTARKLNLFGLVVGIVFYLIASAVVIVVLTVADHDEVNDN